MNSPLEALAARPIAQSERFEILDVLRGFAILGILLFNMGAFSGHDLHPAALDPDLWGGAYERPARLFINLFIHGKFYSLFSFLFGIGFAVLMQRAEARDGGATQLLKRRFVGLLLIGLVHTFLIWFGDILTVYALFGFALLAFRRQPDRALIRWIAALLLCPIVIYGVGALGAIASGLSPGPGADSGMGALPPFLAAAVEHFRSGGYLDIVRGNVAFTAGGWVRRLMLFMLPRIFGMFLLGYLAGRRGLYRDLEAERPLLWKVLQLALLVGLPASAGYAWLMERAIYLPPTPTGWLMTTLESVGTPLLSLGYVAGLSLAWLNPGMQRALSLLAPVGRMALTNYLLQSVIGIAIFYGIGFGLLLRVGLVHGLWMALVVFTLQVVLSHLWLKRFAFGPVEWGWRQFTYRKRVALGR